MGLLNILGKKETQSSSEPIVHMPVMANSPLKNIIDEKCKLLAHIDGYIVPGYGEKEIESFRTSFKEGAKAEDVEQAYKDYVDNFVNLCLQTENLIERAKASANELDKDIMVSGYLLKLQQKLGFNIALKDRIDLLASNALKLGIPSETVNEFKRVCRSFTSVEFIDSYYYDLTISERRKGTIAETVEPYEETDIFALDAMKEELKKEEEAKAIEQEVKQSTEVKPDIVSEYVTELENLGFGPLIIKKFKNNAKDSSEEQIKAEYENLIVSMTKQKETFEQVLAKIKNGELSKNRQRLAFLLNVPQDYFRNKIAKLEKGLLILQYKEEVGYRSDYKRKFTIYSDLLRLMGYGDKAIASFVSKVSEIVKYAKEKHLSIQEMSDAVDMAFREEVKKIEDRAELYFLYYEANYNTIKQENSDDKNQVRKLKQLLDEIVHMLSLSDEELKAYYAVKDSALIEELWQEELKKGLYYTESEKKRARALLETKCAKTFENKLKALRTVDYQEDQVNNEVHNETAFGYN